MSTWESAVALIVALFLAYGLGSGGRRIYRRNTRHAQARESIERHSHDRGQP